MLFAVFKNTVLLTPIRVARMLDAVVQAYYYIIYYSEELKNKK